MNNTNNGIKKKLLIIGAGGHGRVVADIALKMNKWESVAFLDDDKNKKSSMGLEIIGDSRDTEKYIIDNDLFVAIGDNRTRKKLQDELEIAGASIPILVHPSAVIGCDVEIGIGTVLMAGVIINSCSTIGKGCIINTSASIDHDNKLGDYVHISPGVHLAGTVEIGKETWIGIGTIVNNDIKITNGCTVGAGSLVIKDINEIGTYIGHPTTRIKK